MSLSLMFFNVTSSMEPCLLNVFTYLGCLGSGGTLRIGSMYCSSAKGTKLSKKHDKRLLLYYNVTWLK
jgi:hypothetical protein